MDEVASWLMAFPRDVLPLDVPMVLMSRIHMRSRTRLLHHRYRCHFHFLLSWLVS